MDPSSTASITEFAIVVAGFTGLIFALAPKEGSVSPVVKLRAITMLFYSFSAAFGSLLPTIMNAYGVNDIWRSSSYFLVVILIGNMAATFLSSFLSYFSQVLPSYSNIQATSKAHQV